jgi:Bacterial Ig domain/WD40-like Beta Propeller Repeat
MSRCLVLCVSLIASVLLLIPASGSATSIPGPPGKIVFTSGRPSEGVPAPNTGDKASRIYVADYPSGTPVQVTTKPTGENVRHRQPNWSPDHTRIAYAAGVNPGSVYSIWILDLRTGSQTEFVPAAEGQDRPSWSPDGTEIAYSATGDLWVKGVAPGSEAVQLTNTASAKEERPVWSPDGNTLYYNREAVPPGVTKRDLYKLSPVTPGGEQKPILTTEEDEWQPSLSPDGKTLCFTRGPMSNVADTYLISVNGGLVTPFAISSAGNINCVWSPDGTEIIYTLGVFGDGDLARKDLSGASQSVPSSWKVAEHFDGNTDWATNFPPTCEDRNLNIDVNQFTTVPLSCTDPDSGSGAEPPTPEPIDDSYLEIVSPPSHGTLGGISNDEQVIYTPNKDFRGTDTFTYTGEDSTSNVASAPATVTIQVGAESGGGGDRTAPVISALQVSAKRWRLGNRLASVSVLPVGTTISFRLSEAAKTTLTFQRARPGRRAGRKCVKPTAANRGKKRCTRFVGTGSLSGLNGKQGRNRVRFQGRLNRRKKLKPGRYRVVARARDAAGNRSKPRIGPAFTIAR